jgi:hypothetical protein
LGPDIRRWGGRPPTHPQRGYLYESGQTRSHRLALQSASRFQCSGRRGHGATGDTENDINAGVFLYWTHADAGRRLGFQPTSGQKSKRARPERETRITSMGAGSAASQGGIATIPPTRVKLSPDMRSVTSRRPTRPFGPPRTRFPNGVRVFRA